MEKLTLSIEAEIIERAKRFAARNGTSVSRLVSGFLDAISVETRDEEDPPVLRRLRGTLSSADPSEYQSYLSDKYGC